MIEGKEMTSEENVAFSVEIFVSDFDKSLNYYVDILGFEIHRLDKENKFATLKFNNVIFMIQGKENLEEVKRVAAFRFIINNIESYYKKIKEKGAIISAPLKSQDYGLIRFKVKDPEGFVLKFAQVK